MRSPLRMTVSDVDFWLLTTITPARGGASQLHALENG